MIRLIIFISLIPLLINAQNPNYSEHVAPIIYNKCLQCHNVDGIAPLSLETYADAVSNAGLIQHVTSTGEMPPWPPDTLFQNYAYENTLNENEINTILDWVMNGVPLGDTTLLPDMPVFSDSSNLGPADLVIQMPIYSSVATSNSDDYVCFSIPTGLIQNRTIRALEVIPGNPQTVHHVLVSVDDNAGSNILITPNCMGPQGDLIFGYAPGSKPLIYPSDITNNFGVELPAYSSVVLGMHYPEGSAGALDSTKVKFYFYPQNTSVRSVSTEFLINKGLPPDPPFYIPPNQITDISSSFGPIMQDVSLMSIFPHMHLLGKQMECIAVTPTNDTINLVRVNNWDFEWQGFYFYKKFLKIPAGSMIYASGSYDNTLSIDNPNPIPVQTGLNTQDEMFLFVFQYTDYQLGDENISIENELSTNIFTNTNLPSGNLLSIFNILGQKQKIEYNKPLLYLYDNGKTNKKIVID